MTIQDKMILARFFNKAMAHLSSGYEEKEVHITEEGDFSSLPLAFQVEEEWDEKEFLSDDSIISEINACTACSLGMSRTKAVPGEGADEALVMVIGEGPGAEEDTSGRPFVGRAGQLLDRMLASIGLYREKNCYIANVLKCRPPNNRDPQTEEIQACAGFLERQIGQIKPKIILCAGRISARHILRTEEGVNKLRGKFGEYDNIPVLVTYHPSALLRDESLKRPAFEDMKLLMARLSGLDKFYAVEVKDLLEKYAAGDEEFAELIKEYQT